ncbi:MAG TPA: sigma-70 family RNA polymerase sigma factor [Fimbriiglobus sp.]|nr:sigma-70 family RNA polymerase sigma factor [Fimbriiglobus sp.]
MSNEQSALLRSLLARCEGGDESARRELIDRTYERLRRLAAVILNESFPRLKDTPALLDTTDVTNEAALKLYEALAEIRPATGRDFFRLAAQRIRWLLLDQAKRIDREGGRPTAGRPDSSPPDGSKPDLPPALAALYEQIEQLPEQEREVVDLLYFHGLTQAEAATYLDVSERTIRRRWTVAKVQLYEGLKFLLPPGGGDG